MSRFALLVWLAMPLVIVGALAMMMDRTRGRPDPRQLAIEQARIPGQAVDSPRDQASIDRDIAETRAREERQRQQGGAAGDARPATAQAAPKMVTPESLQQGFTIVVEDKSKTASTESPIYIASSHNGWNPADPAMKLTRRSDMRWQIVLPKPELDSRMAFKFTRGSWDLVEVDPKYEDIDNRLLPEVDAARLGPGEKPVIELTVEAWRDQRPWEPARVAMNPYRKIEVGAGTLKRVEVVGGGASVGARDVLVWLPPGYADAANAQKTYPVLYMQDGQNLFEKLPGLPAEWRADETAARLIEEGRIEPVIIVGIPHAGTGRAGEYSPAPLLEGVEPRGRAYIEFVINQVKPRIDRAFRTATGPENTAIGGASLGGLIALEAATERPDVFGKVLAESTPLAIKQGAGFQHFVRKKNWPAKVYFGMGGKEAGTDAADDSLNRQYVASAGAFRELLRGRGFTDQTLLVKVDPEAVHNEEAWAARFAEALVFLFPAK